MNASRRPLVAWAILIIAIIAPLESSAQPKQLGDSFWGDSWGVGLALIKNRPEKINDVSSVNGIVRVNDSQAYSPKFLVTRHWYFSTPVLNASGDPTGKRICTWAKWGACGGIFLGVGFGENQGMDMIGGGFVVGFGSKASDDGQIHDHNIGIGFGRQFHVKSLGDGVAANSALPAGESQVRTKYRDSPVPWFFMYTHKF